MKIIDGTKIANEILDETKLEILENKLDINVKIILASNDLASIMYTNLKKKRALEVGINLEIVEIDIENDHEYIINLINDFNLDNDVHGIMVQLPLYEHLEDYRSFILNSIRPEKDIDGQTDINIGRTSGLSPFAILPATVDSIIECLTDVQLEKITWNKLKNNFIDPDDNFFTEKNVLIINNTNVIGKPLSQILSTLNATVSIANKFTKNLKEIALNSDIIISATGKTSLIDSNWVKTNAIIIDVTSVKVNDTVKGDVILSSELEQKLEALTPVPGGVGPVTIACLLRNCLKAYKFQNN